MLVCKCQGTLLAPTHPTPPDHDRIIPCTTSKYTTAKNNNPSGAASQPVAYNSQKNGCSEGERVRKREWKRGSLKQRGLNHPILKSLVIHTWSFIPAMWPIQPFKHSVIQSIKLVSISKTSFLGTFPFIWGLNMIKMS